MSSGETTFTELDWLDNNMNSRYVRMTLILIATFYLRYAGLHLAFFSSCDIIHR